MEMDADTRTVLDRLATAVTVGSVASWGILVVDATVRDNGVVSDFWSRVTYVASVTSWAIVLAFVVAIVLDLAEPRVVRERVLGVAASLLALANGLAAFAVFALDDATLRSAVANRVESAALYLLTALVAATVASVALRAERPARAAAPVE